MSKKNKKEVENMDEVFGEVEGKVALEVDENGNAYLPSMEEYASVEVVEMIDLAKQIELEYKPAFASARDALINAKNDLSELAHQNIEHFEKNPQNENQLIYRFGKVTIKITQTQEKIETKLEKDELLDE